MTIDHMSPRTEIGPDAAYSKILDRSGQWVGIYEWHRCAANEAPGLFNDGLTPGWIPFDTEAGREVSTPDAPKWGVSSWEPLTLDGSLLCRSCGRHGWIRGDRWVDA